MQPFKSIVAAALLCITTRAFPDARADFLKLIDRPRVDLAAQVDPPKTTDGLDQINFSYATDATQRVPGILLKSSKAPARSPVVIALHGTGGAKEQMLPLMRDLVARGFIAVAIDGRYHGHRTKAGKGSAEYDDAIYRTWHDAGPTTRPTVEHPLYYDTVWDISRLIDYLQTRGDIDASRIGAIGISKGGIETYFAAAADPRIAVAVPCIGVQSFDWEIEHDQWQGRVATFQPAFDAAIGEAAVEHADRSFVRSFFDRVTPGIAGEFDGPAMLRLIAPRPLMMINGDIDPHTPLPGVTICIDAATAAYHAAGVEDHFAFSIEAKTAHKVTPESQAAAIEWFVQWLKPDAK
ncbi:MAG TPA: acetylxylan esterase [Tepidisphaeraceae bacterium]|nr:acetylxylan esterase [Tepidisphaeraceae bacterium]